MPMSKDSGNGVANCSSILKSLEMSYHIIWNWVSFWSLKFLLVSSLFISLTLQKQLSDHSLLAYSVVCAGLVKWLGEKEWIKSPQGHPKIRIGALVSGMGKRGKMGINTMSIPRCWQCVAILAHPGSWDCTLAPSFKWSVYMENFFFMVLDNVACIY